MDRLSKINGFFDGNPRNLEEPYTIEKGTATFSFKEGRTIVLEDIKLDDFHKIYGFLRYLEVEIKRDSVLFIEDELKKLFNKTQPKE